MPRREYVFPSPVVETQADRAEITSVDIRPLENRVAITIQRRMGAEAVGSTVLAVPMSQLDVFINNAAAFPGNGFLEKVLRFFAQGKIFPPGGAVGGVE